MYTTSESHIVFYCFIAIIVGVGLFFSRRKDQNVQQYFGAGKTISNGVIAVSFLMIAFFNLSLLVLPSLPAEFVSGYSVGIIAIAIVLPLLIGSRLVNSVKNLINSCSGVCRLFLTIHGLFFLCFVQILVLLHISNFLISQFFGEANYSLLVVMIVAAGVYTLVGGLNAVLYTNVVVGVFSIASFVLIFLNTLFFQQPLFFSLKLALQAGAENFRMVGAAETNMAIAVIGIAFIMFWIMWMEFGEAQRKASAKTHSISWRELISSIILLLVMLFGVFSLAESEIITSHYGVVKNLDVVNHFIGISFIGGLIGMFAVTFQAVGAVVALRLIPSIKQGVKEEERVLVGRLSTVFVVLLSIFFIPFAKASEYAMLIWYINFLAFFSTPIVAAFLSSLLLKKGNTIGFMSGVFIGEVYACIEFVAQKSETHISFLQSTNAYAFAMEITIVTFCVTILSAIASEMIVVQRLFSHIKRSRSA